MIQKEDPRPDLERMHSDEMCPEHLVARHMARRWELITDRTANSVCRWMEGPLDESLMIPPEDGAHPGSASRAECFSAL